MVQPPGSPADSVQSSQLHEHARAAAAGRARLGSAGRNTTLAVELRLAVLEHREQQVLARAEMGEQARLRHAGRIGQGADGQASRPSLLTMLQRLVEDRGARALAFRLDGAGLTALCTTMADEE